MGDMQNEAITIEHPLTEQSPHVDGYYQSAQETVRNAMKALNKSPMNPTPLEYSWWKTHWSVIPMYAFVVFTLIVIVVGVLIVYFTSLRGPDKPCEPTFKASIERTNVYDSRPRQVSIGAFNKNKHLDLVVANFGTDCIGILMGYGNGAFATQITQSTGLGSHPYSVAVGDFNNDTELDIVVANYGTNSIGVLLGYGNGSFADPIITSLGSSRPLSIAVGDFDDDKILDIAVANYGTLTVIILLGTNDGSFRINTIYQMGYDSIPYSIAVADLNKDDSLDLAIVNYGTSELVIVLRNGNGSFAMHKYSTGASSHPTSIGVASFDKDDALDIAVTNSDTGNVGIFLGYGDGRFKNLVKYFTDSDSCPQSLVISDFNNDTLLDIALADVRNNSVLILKGNRNGSFSTITTHATGINSDPCSITVGDFDSDGTPDIAIANNGTNNIFVLTSFHIYPTTIPASYSTGKNSVPHSITVSDFNEDNYLDIVVPNSETNNVGVFINLGNGSFRDQQTHEMGNHTGPFFVVTGDLNNDKHSDIVVVLNYAHEVAILLGYGDGTFRNGSRYFIEHDCGLCTASLGDFSSDDNLDIIIADHNGSNVIIFLGFGDGTFTNRISLFPEGSFHPECAGVGDFNNDNIMDIAASDIDMGIIAILLGYGNGSFQDQISTSTGDDRPNAFTIGDVNSDNHLDIVYTEKIFSHVGVLLGSGTGTFVNLTRYSTSYSSEPRYLSLGYYNDDALIDIVVGDCYDSSINIYMGTGNGLFGARIRISTGDYSNPCSVMFADFDNDNQQDIAVASYQPYIIFDSYQNNGILIFLVQNYYGDFANETSYTTGAVPHSSSLDVADLDDDGRLDVVVANSGTDNIELLLNYNKGVFVNRTIFSTDRGSHPQSVTTADFNCDHLLDIAVVNSWNNSINVFIGAGNGSFDTKRVYPIRPGSAPSAIAAGDFNKDRRMDVVVANEDADNVTVFLAHDYVMFTSDIFNIPNFVPHPTLVVTADFDNDGRLDVAVVNEDYDGFGVYLGYGNGTLAGHSLSGFAGCIPRALAVGDFNNDSYLDVVTGNCHKHSIDVYLGYGDGNFSSPRSYYLTDNLTYPQSAAIGDFNSDNRLDFVVTIYNGSNIWVFLGYGDGTFTGRSVHLLLRIPYLLWVNVNDLNNDTFLDIIIANFATSNIMILSGYGNGSFGNVTFLPTGPYSLPISLSTGDLNKDGFLDIVVANQGSKSIGIFFGYGNGTFSLQKICAYNSTFFLFSIVVGDVNNDTMLDILVTDCNQADSSIGILYGYGDGNFTLPTIYSTRSITWSPSLAIGDFDNDGRMDLAVTHFYLGSISIMLQREFDPFGPSEVFSTGDDSRPKSVAIGDFNNDNQLDIVVANSGANNIGILLGYRNGKFSNQSIYSTGSNFAPSSIATGDFNNDHYLDIAVVSYATGYMGILLGHGNGTFANMLNNSTGIGSSPSCVAVGDLNKDNRLDWVVAYSGTNNVVVFSGNGDGTFFKTKSYSLDYGTHPQSVGIGDMNNDGLLDIVVVNDGPNYIEILLQTCSFDTH